MSLLDGIKFFFNPAFVIAKVFTLWDGGGEPASIQTATNIPPWMQEDQRGLWEATKRQVFNVDEQGNILGVRPYVPYSANPEDYVAGFSPLQEQALSSIANLSVPGEYQRAAGLAEQASRGAIDSAQRAYGYGQQAADYGARGAAFGDTAARFGAEGAGYGRQASQFGAEGAGYGRQAANYGAQGLRYGQQASDFGQRAADFGAEGAGYGRQAAGYGAQGLRYGERAAGYGDLATGYGAQAAGYGNQAANLGLLGLQERGMASNVASQSQELARQQAAAGDRYAQLATDEAAVGEYMSPYVQRVINQQKDAAIRDYNIQRTQRQARTAKAGALGGSRRFVEEAEAERALNTQLQGIEAQGLQNAYDRAIQSLQFGSTTGMQGLAGAQSGLSTALAGGQLGLQGIQSGIQGAQAGMQGAQAGMQGAGLGIQGAQAGMQGVQTGVQAAQAGMQGAQTGMQGAGLGIQGAQAGMQGVQTGIQGAQAGMQGAQTGIQGAQAGMQGAQTGIQGAQAGMQGAQTGIQGAQAGLQGVAGAQAGFSTGIQGAGQLANVGQGQTQAALNITNAQTQAGAMEQQQNQNIINQAVQNYATAQAFPQEQLGYMSTLLAGSPSPGSVVRNYQGAPSVVGTAGALGTAAIGARQAGLFKEGGIVNLAKGGAVMGYADGGDVTDIDNVERIAQDLSLPQLQQSIQNKTIPEYIGLPLLAQKQQEQQRMQMAQAAQQAPQGIATIKDRIMQGVDALPSNLYPQGTVNAAGGGIVAFAAGGEVPGYAVGGVPAFPFNPSDIKPYDLTPYKEMYAETLNPATGKPYTEDEIFAQQEKKRESRGIKDIYGEEMKETEERIKKLPSEEKEMMGYAIMSGAFEALADGSPNTARFLGNLGAKVSKNAAGVKREFKALAREERKEKRALRIAQDQAARADLAGDQAAFERYEQKSQGHRNKLADINNKATDLFNEVKMKGSEAEYGFLKDVTLQGMKNQADRASGDSLKMENLRLKVDEAVIGEIKAAIGEGSASTYYGDNRQIEALDKKMRFENKMAQTLGQPVPFPDNVLFKGVRSDPGGKTFLSNAQKLGLIGGSEERPSGIAAPNVVQPKVDMKIPTIKTREEYNKLKSGAQYIDPNGIVRTKQ